VWIDFKLGLPFAVQFREVVDVQAAAQIENGKLFGARE
jgi:hypothetical protein